MKIEIRDETQKLILSDEELDNNNFIDLELYDESEDEDNPLGFVTEITVPLEDLKCAVDAFWQKKMNGEKEIIDISNSFSTCEHKWETRDYCQKCEIPFSSISAKINALITTPSVVPCNHNFQILPNGSYYCRICEARKLKL